MTMRKLTRVRISFTLRVSEDLIRTGPLDDALEKAEEALNEVGKVCGAMEVHVGHETFLKGSKAMPGARTGSAPAQQGVEEDAELDAQNAVVEACTRMAPRAALEYLSGIHMAVARRMPVSRAAE